jgi:hypothetical protein
MTAPTLYRIIDCFPYLDREEEYRHLTLEEAVLRMEDLIGHDADSILSDFDEDCERCGGEGEGSVPTTVGAEHGERPVLCPDCNGSGKRSDPWEWVDDESGREVTMRREVG